MSSKGDAVSRAPLRQIQAALASPTTFAALSLAVFAGILIISAVRHEPWEDETHSWRLAIDSENLRALYANARYEGTPLLFHVLLQSLGKLSRSWWAAVVLHSAFACGSAWLVLRYAPFPRLERLLVVGGYYFAFEYAVIVRSYALGVFLALLACAVWTAQARRPALVVLLLILLANTSAMGTILSAALGFAFLYERHRLSAVVARVGGITSRRVSAGAIALLVFGMLCVFFVFRQLLPPSDASFRGTGIASEGVGLYRIGSAASPLVRAFRPLAKTADGVPMWNSWVLYPTSRLQMAVLDLSFVMLSVGLLITVSRRRVSMMLLGISGAMYLFFFAFFFESGGLRHHGHLFIAWVLARWLSEAGEATPFSSRMWLLMRSIAPYRSRLAMALLVPSFVVGLQFILADIRYPFSDVKRVATLLRADSLARLPVVAVSFSSSSVSGWMDRPFMTPATKRLSTFSSPSQPGAAQVAGIIDSIVAPLLQRGCAVIFVSHPGRDLSPSLQSGARLLTETPSGVLSGERMIVWMIPGRQSAECAFGAPESR